MDGLTQDGLAYCGFGRGGASNAEWPQQDVPDRSGMFGGPGDAPSAVVPKLEYRASLARTIEAEIIPRLMLLHQTSIKEDRRPVVQPVLDLPEMEETVGLCDLLIHGSVAASTIFVQDLIARPISMDVLYLALFAPAAKRLGELWEADICSFADVTIGLSRLQQLMHSLSAEFCGDGGEFTHDRRVLLVGIPGEQHTLGLFMVSEFFRRAGWDVSNEPTSTRAMLMAVVAAERFDVIGLSAASATRVESIAPLISAIRAASLNKNIVVLVGGPVFGDSPDLAFACGADAAAGDARHALSVAEMLVARKQER